MSSFQVSIQMSDSAGGALQARKNEHDQQGTEGLKDSECKKGEFGGLSAYPIRPSYGTTTDQGEYGHDQVEAFGWDCFQHDDFRQGEPRGVPPARDHGSASHQPERAWYSVEIAFLL